MGSGSVFADLTAEEAQASSAVAPLSASDFRPVQPASPSLIPARRHTHISTTHFDLSYVIISGNAANVVRNIAAAKKALEDALAL